MTRARGLGSLTRLAALAGAWLALGASATGADAPMKAKMAWYSGMVQGVGFRATTAMIAKDFAVTGWVKNLSDGRVQLLVEGRGEAVDKFLKAVRDHWKDNIDKVEEKEQKPTGEFKGFRITE
jgi:acylphosphatase